MSWLAKAVIYQIFIDRFAGYDPDRDWRIAQRMGGNLRGVINTFDYIKSLGINTIWLSPFYKALSYHGYDITDFYAVDEHVGTEADLKELIGVAHANGIRVIADFVPNHLSSQHPYFVDAQQNPQSPYRDWFIFTRWPDVYVPFYTYASMPKINHANPQAREYILGAARKWLQLGLDGYRVDHVIGLTNNNIDALFKPLKSEFPNAVFFGEAAMFDTDGEPTSKVASPAVSTFGIPGRRLSWLLGVHGLNKIFRNYIGHLDGILDFYALYQFVRLARGANADRIRRRLQHHAKNYPADFVLIYFLDNHDQNRYLFRVNGDTTKLLMAADIQFSLPGAKVIYYGTEVGMNQEMSFVQAHGDTQARQPMPWNERVWDRQLLEAYKKLIASNRVNDKRNGIQ